MYLYLLHSKNEALDVFKVFKNEVEKQCGKQIKIVRSDRGGDTMVGILKVDKHLVHFQNFFKIMGLLPSTLCLVL